MSQAIHKVPEHAKQRALITEQKYQQMYQQSVSDPEGFWREHSSALPGLRRITKLKTPALRPVMSILSGSRMAL